jgi:hypothetical protein
MMGQQGTLISSQIYLLDSFLQVLSIAVALTSHPKLMVK